MKLESIRLINFRNHTETSIECSVAINVFLGDNGEGKTNILEAISFLCLTKSFYANSDITALQLGRQLFHVEGDFLSDGGTEFRVQLSFKRDEGGKEFLVNKKRIEKLSSVIGMFPVVILSPENSAITLGAPADRRRFIDMVIAQASKAYLEDILEYRRILRQRNRILMDAKISRTNCSGVIEPWDESMVEHGARIIHRRAVFVEEFQPYVLQAYGQLSGEAEEPSIEYLPGLTAKSCEDVTTVAEQFRTDVARNAPEERRAGSTIVGPHRDELMFKLGNLDLRRFASQGQHKTFLVALKMAEFSYLKDSCRENPVLLLDDVFSELDEHRSKNLLALTRGLAQTFITTTDELLFNGSWRETNRKFYVKQGTVRHAETPPLLN